jgi:predicted translin family RNA/ssDNA-binding protein|nr:MAG TPA: Prefoldin subunit 1, Prefoldin subunit/CCT, PFD, CryoEM, Molecular Chaperone.3A [Bacteriophage sp.]
MKYKTIDELKMLYKNKPILNRLSRSIIILDIIANDFESKNEELDEISLKAAHLKKEIQELKKDIYKKLNE